MSGQTEITWKIPDPHFSWHYQNSPGSVLTAWSQGTDGYLYVSVMAKAHSLVISHNYQVLLQMSRLRSPAIEAAIPYPKLIYPRLWVPSSPSQLQSKTN